MNASHLVLSAVHCLGFSTKKSLWWPSFLCFFLEAMAEPNWVSESDLGRGHPHPLCSDQSRAGVTHFSFWSLPPSGKEQGELVKRFIARTAHLFLTVYTLYTTIIKTTESRTISLYPSDQYESCIWHVISPFSGFQLRLVIGF